MEGLDNGQSFAACCFHPLSVHCRSHDKERLVNDLDVATKVHKMAVRYIETPLLAAKPAN